MRQLTIIFILIWSALTVVGLVFVRPATNADRGMIEAVWDLADRGVLESTEMDFRVWYQQEHPQSDAPPAFATLLRLNESDPARVAIEDAFRHWYDSTHDVSLNNIPRLVWATDDNPARRIQIQLFRKWHLEKYGELVDVITDPASRDTRDGASVTKPVIQSIGGAGADILETYGPKQLEAMVRSGIAMDVTDQANELGFNYKRCFDAGWSSFVYNDRQYGFPANVGYVVLLYHRDLFEEANINIPDGGWTIDAFADVCNTLSIESADIPGGKRWGVVGMHPWPMSLSAGASFFTPDGTRCTFNSPETVGAFQAYLDLMYTDKVMPTPADTASMAAAGGFTGGGNNGLYFAAKLTAMTIGGRWEYVTYAESNYNKVIRPALIRALEQAESVDGKERIDQIMQRLDRDLLLPLKTEDYAFIQQILTEEDRHKLMQVGVAHVPTVHGNIKYTDVGARVALVNRKSKLQKYALRFLEFLGSEAYNEQINQTYDSICGVVEYCVDEDGISGMPDALPGMEEFDSPVFVQAMNGAESQQLSPFIGPERLGYLAGQVMDQLTSNRLTASEAARLIENRVNEQIRANLIRDDALRSHWEALTETSFDPEKSFR